MLSRRCPACGVPFRKPLRPEGAIGAAAYLQFCPHCLRELVYGPGLRVRIVLIAAVATAWFAGLFSLGGPALNAVLRFGVAAALVVAWWKLPTWAAGPRRYDEATGMVEELET